MNIERRRFLHWTGLGLGGLALPALPRSAFAADNDQVLLTVFMRGGADGMSLLHPVASSSPTPERQRYEAWRGPQTRIANGIPVGRLAIHPALAPLQNALDAGHLMMIGGVGGAQPNRSHFEQQDLVETGAGPTGSPLSTGVLARAVDELGRADQVLSSVSLNTTPPESLKASVGSGLSVPDFRSFGALRSSTHTANANLGLARRMNLLYLPESGVCRPGAVLCENGRRGADAIGDIESLRDTAGLPSGRPASLSEVLQDTVGMIAADNSARFKCITLDVGGWDTHLEQGNDATNDSGAFVGTLARNLNGLATALAAFYDRAGALSVWSRVNVLVLTEFGRTTRQNGTSGTDHGFGGTALLMGSRLARRITAPAYFPRNQSHAFYTEAESTNGTPRRIDHRQVFADILTDRLGVDDLSAVLPGFSRDTTVPRLYM